MDNITCYTSPFLTNFWNWINKITGFRQNFVSEVFGWRESLVFQFRDVLTQFKQLRDLDIPPEHPTQILPTMFLM